MAAASDDAAGGGESPAPAPRDTEVADELKQLLERQLDAMARKTLASDGRVDEDDTTALHHLSNVVDLLERSRPRPRYSRVPLVAALAAAALLIFLLSVLRVQRTEVVIELTVSEFTIKLSGSQEFAPALSLASLGISGAQSIEIPSTFDPALRGVAGDAFAALRLDKVNDDSRQGSIDLGPVVAPEASQINVSMRGAPGQYRISLADAPMQLNASVSGPVRLTVAGQVQEKRDFVAPKPVWIRSGSATLNLDFALAKPMAIGLAPQIDVDRLSVHHVDPPRIGDRRTVRPMSSIRSGTVYLVALDSKERKLLPHELLGFEQIHGQVSALRLEPEQISLRFQGTVQGMSLGSVENYRSLMPTLLEWLRERHGLSLFWGSVLYLFGLLSGVLRWWKTSS